MKRVRYWRSLEQVSHLSERERQALAPVAARYKFRANSYYLKLIDWDDPDDPIRRIVIPQTAELRSFGHLDASNEVANYVAPATQHKYASTVLLLCNEVCGAYCRFCFRKRLFMDENDETATDLTAGIDYIRRHPEVTNVLLTGGDPLLLSTRRLEAILRPLSAIPHVRIIRIGTKMPAFNPYRILDDPDLVAMLSRYCTADKQVYLMTHFNVPQELTEVAVRAITTLRRAGLILANQSPILRGINDSPERLAELMRRLAVVGAPAYYFFICRPTEGNRPFELPIVDAYHVFTQARRRVSGLAKRARLVMSHASGKVEVVAVNREYIYLRYHRAKAIEDEERLVICHRDDSAYWLDDLVPVTRYPGQIRAFRRPASHIPGPE